MEESEEECIVMKEEEEIVEMTFLVSTVTDMMEQLYV